MVQVYTFNGEGGTQFGQGGAGGVNNVVISRDVLHKASFRGTVKKTAQDRKTQLSPQ